MGVAFRISESLFVSSLARRLGRLLVPATILALVVSVLTIPFAPSASAATQLVTETFTGTTVSDPGSLELGMPA